MIIYNVTIKVNNRIAVAWLQWLKEEHIPDMIQTGCFSTATILHLIEADDNEGITYAVQYHAANKEDYDRYIEIYADKMRKKGMDKWGDQFIAFRTLMRIVN
jgi:uncharacterized protein DUF4286